MDPLDILPPEVFLQVLESIDDIQDKASARSVSKDWKTVVSSTKAWKPIFDAYSAFSRLPHPIRNPLNIFMKLDTIYREFGGVTAPFLIPIWISKHERLHCDERLHNTPPFRFGSCSGLGFSSSLSSPAILLGVIYALTVIFSKRQLWNDWPGLQIATIAVCLVASILLAFNKGPPTIAYCSGIFIWMLALAAEIDFFDGAMLLTSILMSCFFLVFLLANVPGAYHVKWAGSAVRYFVIATAGAYSGLLFVVPYLLVASAALLLVAPWLFKYTRYYPKTSVLATLLQSPAEFSLAFTAVVIANAGLAVSKMSLSRNLHAVHTISPWFLITSISMTILLISLTQVFVFMFYVLSRADAMQAFFSKAILAYRLAAESRIAISTLAIFIHYMMLNVIIYRIVAPSIGATIWL